MTPELEDAIRNIGLVLSQAHITLKGNPLTGAEHLSLFNAHKLMVDKIQEGQKTVKVEKPTILKDKKEV